MQNGSARHATGRRLRSSRRFRSSAPLQQPTTFASATVKSRQGLLTGPACADCSPGRIRRLGAGGDPLLARVPRQTARGVPFGGLEQALKGQRYVGRLVFVNSQRLGASFMRRVCSSVVTNRTVRLYAHRCVRAHHAKAGRRPLALLLATSLRGGWRGGRRPRQFGALRYHSRTATPRTIVDRARATASRPQLRLRRAPAVATHSGDSEHNSFTFRSLVWELTHR